MFQLCHTTVQVEGCFQMLLQDAAVIEMLKDDAFGGCLQDVW